MGTTVSSVLCYLYRAIDSTGATIDFLLSALRDAAAAKRLFRKAVASQNLIRAQRLGKFGRHCAA
jgi:transposase-like protein